MSILISQDTALLVQGITGYQARFETRLMVDYGTRVVAGVSLSNSREHVEGVPVYSSVAEATRVHDVDAAIGYVPADAVRDSVMEALTAGVKLVFIPTERVPVRDVAYVVAAARDAGARIIGPNSQGVIVPGVARIGGPGGADPERIFSPGTVGVVSRSGGMAGEISWLLKRRGLGTSTQVHIGGEALLGTTFVDVLELFDADAETQAIALFGERGAPYEEQVARFVAAGGTSKPIVAFVAGASFDEVETPMQFGHSGNIARGGAGRVADKVAALEAAGVSVARTVPEIAEILAERLSTRVMEEQP